MSDEQLEQINEETSNVNDREFTDASNDKDMETPKDLPVEKPAVASSEEKSIDELPLPGDEEEETEADKKEKLPKWAEKRLSKKDREIAQKAHEAETLRQELER